MQEKTITGFQAVPSLPVVLWTRKKWWCKALFWAGLCTVAFLIVNTISFEYFISSGHKFSEAALAQLPASLKWLAPRIAPEFFLMAIGYGILSGTLLALSSRLLTWLIVIVIFVLTIGTLGLCQIIVFAD
jgi:hypothetical protein